MKSPLSWNAGLNAFQAVCFLYRDFLAATNLTHRKPGRLANYMNTPDLPENILVLRKLNIILDRKRDLPAIIANIKKENYSVFRHFFMIISPAMAHSYSRSDGRCDIIMASVTAPLRDFPENLNLFERMGKGRNRKGLSSQRLSAVKKYRADQDKQVRQGTCRYLRGME